MITFRNRNEFRRKNIDKKDDTASTLLVPLHLYDDFLQKTKKHKGKTSVYLHSLLRRFRTITHSGMIPSPEQLKTSYQERNLFLKRVNFKPKNVDWIELGELALAFGKSRCWVFVFLLELDLLGLWKSIVVAGLKKIVPMVSRLELEVFQRLERFSYTFARGYHVKV